MMQDMIKMRGTIKMINNCGANLLRYTLVLLLMMTVGVGEMWGQPEGVWYIANNKGLETENFNYNTSTPEQRFYLVPAKLPRLADKKDAYYSEDYTTSDGDPAKPYLTTFKTNKDSNSAWVIKSTGSGNTYFLIHVLTGKYAVYHTTPDCTSKTHRKVIHLESLANPESVEIAKFFIENNYTFRPQSLNSGNRFFNPSNGNKDQYCADGGDCNNAGLIGVYNSNTDGSIWHLEEALLACPTISDLDANNIVTVTDANDLPDGYNIRYTTDGSIPDASSPIMEGKSYTVTSSHTLKAVVERYGMVLTSVATKILVPATSCATPVITFDHTTSKVSISCSTPSSTIHYTTDGSIPTTSAESYSTPFSITDPITVKAIATHSTKDPSAVAELNITQVATPTIQDNGSNAISITTATPGATIYYTTDGSTPTPSSTKYTAPLMDNVSNVTIKAIAVKEDMISSAVGSGSVKLQCATPVITRVGMTFTLSCSFPADASLFYTLGGGSETSYNGPVDFTLDQLPLNLTAVARHNDYTESEEASMELKNGSGTPEDPFLIYGTTDFAKFVTDVNNGTTASACYKLGYDVSVSGVDAITTTFTGTFDGDLYTISGLSHSLFNTVTDGVVKNVILDNVSISGGDNVGAICNEATGDARIYNCGILATNSTVRTDENGYTHISNCSSSVSGSNYVGGIVGLLDGSARVINCFSYANITGGATVGGIVGYNNKLTDSRTANLKTMVMNCMFYGNITGSTNKAPIYNGNVISNTGGNGVGNYNYFYGDAPYVQNQEINTSNCALMAETRFLQRFEFFRNLQNSHRELAAWWATGDRTKKDEMAKWVLLPSQIGSSTPYPVLAKPGYYPSVVNIDAENAPFVSERNKGGIMGTLFVTIETGNGAQFGAPTGASITKSSLTLNITDKDPEHFNFNYCKVQLPYYNDVGTGNYTGNRVVTGWKITSITGGTPGEFKKEDSDKGYNFADRNCTNKDLYNVSGRVFNQGAYWDVPEGVTAITIQPYWAKAAYLADSYADVVYNKDMSSSTNVPNVGGGQIYTNNNNSSIAGDNQKVYTSLNNAVSSLSITDSHTVNDYAVVLVGNYHHVVSNAAAVQVGHPYTVTSIDLDGDDEPDYSLMLRNNGRNQWHPVKWDFINIPGLGMAQKSTGGTGSYNFGIIQPQGWFEATNTSLFRVTQFEYERQSKHTLAAPYILQGGVIEQWVTGQQDGNNDPKNTIYFHIGGNVWFKEFHRGVHQDNTGNTNHTPISVTGGDFDKFYLTGLYRADIASYKDNAECYINGGRFGVVAGAAMEGIDGNITWQIQNADIEEFYGGGLNAGRPVTGNISTTITGGKIDLFCGGPKFGDMNEGKTVTTIATGCEFGTFFGAGYGGNSYSRRAPKNIATMINMPGTTLDSKNYNSWNAWVEAEYKQASATNFPGISTQFSYQFIPNSNNSDNVGRLFVEHVLFSLATTRNVTSTLTNCTIMGNFYGGGSLGKVAGPVTSTLTDCTVKGNVFGAGFSASLPTVEVDSIGFRTEPYYFTDYGTYRTGLKGRTTPYRWEHGNSISIDKINKILYTTEELGTNLGSVAGDVTLTIKGNSKIGTEGDTNTGKVFGGGESSYVTGTGHKVTVNLQGNTEVLGNVFGGGDEGKVEGSATVNIID